MTNASVIRQRELIAAELARVGITDITDEHVACVMLGVRLLWRLAEVDSHEHKHDGRSSDRRLRLGLRNAAALIQQSAARLHRSFTVTAFIDENGA